MRGAGAVIKRTLVSFYDDQMTHHAAALTYYALMSLFPTVLFALSLLGLLGQYPETYNAIMDYAREVAPDSVVTPLDSSLRQALQNKGTATTTLAISAVVAFYGTTGVLEAARRALNVVFEIENGRSFLRRKLVDVASTIVLLALALVTGILVFVGGGFAEDLFDFIGLGESAADIWNIARWPAALLVAMFVFSYVYYITPDVEQRSWRWVTPGAVVGVVLWLLASWGFSSYVSRVADVGAIYGAFTGAIVLVAWLWLTNVALLFGAELNAEIERQKELHEGVPARDTLNRPSARDEASGLGRQRTDERDPALDPRFELPLGPEALGVDPHPAGHLAPAHHHRARVRLGREGLGFVGIDAHEQPALTARRDRHVPADQKGQPAEHPLLRDARLPRDQLPDAVGERLVIGHASHDRQLG